jgi:hypothetical protein
MHGKFGKQMIICHKRKSKKEIMVHCPNVAMGSSSNPTPSTARPSLLHNLIMENKLSE